MYDFWENVLFQSANYNGNPMVVHKNLHQKSTMNQAHFQQWRELFNQTVDSLFVGTKADEIKNRAMNISAVLMHKALG
jgi:hemoglobin